MVICGVIFAGAVSRFAVLVKPLMMIFGMFFAKAVS